MPVLRSDPYDPWEEALARQWIGIMNLTNRVVYESSDGRVAGSIPSGLPLMLLTTTGARTGEPRTVTVVYLDGGILGDPGAYYVVGSNGGLSRHPAWVGNATANPRVKVTIGATERDATASVVTDDEVSSLVISELSRGYAPFRDYGARAAASSRQIRVLRLEVDGGPPTADPAQAVRVSM